VEKVARRQAASKASAQRIRPVSLSITHKFLAKVETQLDVGQPPEATPDDRVAGRPVSSSGQESAELRELGHVRG